MEIIGIDIGATKIKGILMNISGIGICTAGRVNVRSGEVIYAMNNLLGWTGTNVKTIIQERL